MKMRPCDVTSIEAKYIDCCLPDYFLGSNAEEVLAVPVWRGITMRQAYEAAKHEFHSTDGYFSEVAGSGTMAETALHSLFASMGQPELTDQPADFAKYACADDENTSYLYIGLHAESDL